MTDLGVHDHRSRRIQHPTGWVFTITDLGVHDGPKRAPDRLPRIDAADWELGRALAQVEGTFSNSMIEAFWRSLKHSWLYLHSLESFTALRRLIEFYVDQHNGVMPHSAFQGQTPNQIFFAIGDDIAKNLEDARRMAREKRLNENRSSCDPCALDTRLGALLVQRPRSRMS